MTDTPYADPAHFPVGSRHIFALGNARMVFTRVPDGWNGGGGFWDDADMSEHGYRYVRPAD
jgi:hypothetical protein